jgi:alpha-beta hydrolase superfamily lysophospholipase
MMPASSFDHLEIAQMLTLKYLPVLILLAAMALLSPVRANAAAGPTTDSPKARTESATEHKQNLPLVFKQDSDFLKEAGLPTYEWYPKDIEPQGLALAIHGLTMHGKRYELLGKAFAASGYYMVAPDMRGYGRCRSEHNHENCAEDNCKRKVDYEKSFAEISRIATLMKQKYPRLKMIVIGESLGATMAVRLAGMHPELVDRLIISAPAMRVSPRMFFQPSSVAQGFLAVFVKPSGLLNLDFFMNKLISSDPGVVKEICDDPLVVKHLSPGELFKSHAFISKTAFWARKIATNTPVLILQGNLDHCVIPHAVTELTRNIPSNDQTLRWLYNQSHLLLETRHFSAPTVAAITDWFDDHEPEHLAEIKLIEQDLRELGGSVRE